MAHANKFNSALDKLFTRRTRELRSILSTGQQGAPLNWTKKERDKGIKNLQDIAEKALTRKLAKDDFDEYSEKTSYKIKGHGLPEKKELFMAWYKEEVKIDNCIYVFVGKSNGRALYVGKTENSVSRPASHFEKYWASKAKRVDIYKVSQPSQLAKLECLAWHRFEPTENKVRPTNGDWEKSCPMCKILDKIQYDLEYIFNFRS